jgi:hypothetical protein
VSRPEFQVHILNAEGITKAIDLADEFNRFLDRIEDLAGANGRAMAIVRTKLEEACFFAKKALANQPENQK